MTDRRRRFLEAYLSGPRGVQSNATRSAEAAGYAWPGKQGPRLVTCPEIAAAVDAYVEQIRRESSERARERAAGRACRERLRNVNNSARPRGREQT